MSSSSFMTPRPPDALFTLVYEDPERGSVYRVDEPASPWAWGAPRARLLSRQDDAERLFAAERRIEEAGGGRVTCRSGSLVADWLTEPIPPPLAAGGAIDVDRFVDGSHGLEAYVRRRPEWTTAEAGGSVVFDGIRTLSARRLGGVSRILVLDGLSLRELEEARHRLDGVDVDRPAHVSARLVLDRDRLRCFANHRSLPASIEVWAGPVAEWTGDVPWPDDESPAERIPEDVLEIAAELGITATFRSSPDRSRA